MSTFYDSQNQPLALGERLGSGGEGTVYACEDFNLVAKIYHEPVTADKAEKLRWMATNKNERLLKVAAWVIDVLHDAPDGKVVGFVMPNVKAKEIHELYSLKSRRVHFPEATWHFLVHTAANVARAFYNLHRNAHIMGDVNHGNCVVLADGTVHLIDCDSYSIKTDQRRYRCEVGVATHLAPELQGADLGATERENKHDNFGLAVIIFQLLFLGRHPFAGNFLGAEDKSIEDCIREMRFAYGEGAEDRKVKQPPGTLPLNAVSPRIALMFERAFLTEDRPEPREWIEALEDLSNNLEQCSLHPGHLYFNQLAACPWCEIEGQTGLMLFPFITAGKHLADEKPFNVFTVENLLANLATSENLPVRPSPPSQILPPPSNEVTAAKKAKHRMVFIVLFMQFFGLIFIMAVNGIGAAVSLGIILMIALIIYLNNSDKSLREQFDDNLADAYQKWAKLESSWTQNAVPPNFDNDLTHIRQKLHAHHQLQQQSVHQLKRLETDVLRREVFAHLRSQPITEAEQFGITKTERQILAAKGVKTAAEIEENRLRVFHTVDEDSIAKLVEWRKKLVSDFNRETKIAEIVQTEQTRFVEQTTRERRHIEREIERLLIVLRAGSVHIQRRRRQLFSDSEELAKRLLQTKSDVQALGGIAPAIIALILLTLFVPFFGGIFTLSNSSRSDPPRYSPNGTGYSTVDRGFAPPPLPPPPDALIKDTSDVPENITDEEIAALPAEVRQRYAENLLSQTYDLLDNTPDYKKAERKMRLAVRLKSEDTRLLNELGDVLYEQKKYTESLKYLNRSLEIEKDNSRTKLYIGNNYLQMKKFNQAREILSEVTEQYPQSLEGHFNLGLAYIGLKDYQSAVESLNRAVEISPDDADAHYQLGLAYYKSGDRNKAENEYVTLKGIDEKKAEKLRKEAKLDKIVPPAVQRR